MRQITVQDIGEFGIIEKIRRRYPVTSDRVLSGIGDDAASLHLPPDQPILVTTDILIEDIHFTRNSTMPYLLGVKSLAVNLSDIAAMGGIPRFFLLSFGMPKDLPLSFIDRFYQGVSDLAETHGVVIVGGDMSAATKLIINGVVIGHGPPDQIVYRKGARPGDGLFVTGPLGDSALGLEILRRRGLKPRDFTIKGDPRGRDKDLLMLIRQHLAPTPPVQKGRKIAESGCATAMIDISDGLVSDLGHIMKESRVGATVWVDLIPRSPAFKKWAQVYHPSPLDLALGGGEDYELLFTAPEETVAQRVSQSEAFDRLFYPIGEITPHPQKLSLLTKEKTPYSPSHLGFDHFRHVAGRIP
jgi:thiamine-monophosphate kinase